MTPSAWPMYRAMVGVGLLCGLLIVSVYELTRPIIERNKAEALQRAIFDVLPAARSSRTIPFEADGQVYAGYDENGDLAGIAIEARGMGYQDVISVLYGYSIAGDAIIGIRVLESKETPGLGDRIETDPAFLANFEALDVSLNDDLSRIAHPIEAVKNGKKNQPWQVDGITGATISSNAIADILARSTAHWIPRIRRSPEAFDAPAEQDR